MGLGVFKSDAERLYNIDDTTHVHWSDAETGDAEASLYEAPPQSAVMDGSRGAKHPWFA